jgi:hypothetical protein
MPRGAPAKGSPKPLDSIDRGAKPPKSPERRRPGKIRAAAPTFYKCSAAAAIILLAACSIPAKLTGTWIDVAPAPGGGRTAVVNGDWDDVYASALVSADVVEGAVLGRESGTGADGLPWARVRILTIDDETGEIVAERIGPPSRSPGPIRLTARIGTFGNPSREERLIRAVGDRLRELAGREWAPVR